MVGFKILPLNFKVNSESKISQGAGKLVLKCPRRAMIGKGNKVQGERVVCSE